MLSVIILYSVGRREQAELCLLSLRNSDSIGKIQIILACDGVSDYHPDDVEILEVQRPGKHYSLGTVWNAAIARCRYYRVLYLDCDRILPQYYSVMLERELKDGVFLYPDSLWGLDRPIGFEQLGGLRTGLSWPGLTRDERQTDPALFPSKCPISGCTAFTLPTQALVGPMDQEYIGSGYADIDYFMRIRRAGARCQAIPAREIHLYHEHYQDHHTFMVINLWNGVRYHNRWDTPATERLSSLLRQYNLSFDRLTHISLDEAISDKTTMASLPPCS